MHSDDFFSYELTKNPAFLIGILSGKLQQSSVSDFASFQSEVLQTEDVKCVLLDLSQISAVTLDAVPSLVLFQKNLRAKGVQFWLCGLSEPLREKLAKLGVIRSIEVASSLRAAVETVARDRAHLKAS